MLDEFWRKFGVLDDLGKNNAAVGKECVEDALTSSLEDVFMQAYPANPVRMELEMAAQGSLTAESSPYVASMIREHSSARCWMLSLV